MKSFEKLTLEKKTRALSQILSKYCSYLVINELVTYTDLEQSKISEKAGKEKNALSKNLSEIEEITLPTFLRFLEASQTILKQNLCINFIYNEKARETIQMINFSKDIKEFEEFIISQKDYFNNHEFLRLINKKRKFFSENQQIVVNEIIKILKEEK